MFPKYNSIELFVTVSVAKFICNNSLFPDIPGKHISPRQRAALQTFPTKGKGALSFGGMDTNGQS